MTTKTRNGENGRDKLKKLTAEALETLCQSLEQGKSDQMLQYLDVMARFPKYSFRNLLLILTQKPDAQRVMGYKAWQQLDRFVCKDEKAIRIWAPMKIRNNGEERGAGDSRQESDGESSETLLFRPVCVFDVSQTDGKPLPEMAEVSGDPGEHLESLKRFATENGIKLGYETELRGDGVSRCGEILIRLGLDPAAEFHVLAHEVAHELIHTKDKRKELSKAQKETEAEAVAYVVSKSIGLQTGPASSDYIQLWDGDKETVSNSLVAIQHTAAEITAALIQ